MARAGRGRCNLLSRRMVEVNLLIIGALIFVGVGIASLPSDVSRNATLETPNRAVPNSPGNSADKPKTSAIAPKIMVAALLGNNRGMVRTAVLEVAPPTHMMMPADTFVAVGRAFRAAAPSRLVSNAPAPSGDVYWVRSPHPLAVPVAFGREPAPRPIAPAVFTLTPVAPGAEDQRAPLVRLDTRTGSAPFRYVMAGIMLATFASGFWNSRKAHKTKAISKLSV